MQKEPRHAQAHVNLGILLMAQNRAEAMEHYRLAFAANPWLWQARQNLGWNLRDSDPDAARAHLEKACQLDPRQAGNHYKLGRVLAMQGDTKGAAAAYRRALGVDPRLARAHIELGKLLLARDRAKGIEHLRLAVDADPELWLAHAQLGWILRDSDPDKARAHLERACQLEPREAEAHRRLGIVLTMQGDTEGAIAAYEQALAEDPRQARAHVYLGNLLWPRDRAEAISHYRQAIAADPELWRGHYQLGRSLLLDGRPGDALAPLEKALSLGPGTEEVWIVHHGLGLCRHRLGQYALALASFRAHIELGSGRDSSGRYDAAGRHNAACAAVLESANRKPGERAGLRDEALSWLRTNLAHWQKQVARAAELPAAVKGLQELADEADLASVRDPEALGRLPAAERERWQELWTEVSKSLEQARRKAGGKR